MGTEKNHAGLLGLFLLVAAVLIIWLILPERSVDPMLYSMKYWVGASQVHWTAMPTDCDHAPSQGCHYTKSVIAYNAKGEPVAGDGVPKCKHDVRNGTIVISYDGETWTQSPTSTACPDKTVSDVEIKWIRVQN